MNKKFLQNFQQRIITGTLFGALYGGILLFLPPIYFSLLLLITLGIILIFEWPNFFTPSSLPFWLLMPFYPVAPFLCLIEINQTNQPLIFLMLAMVFCFDTGAYLAGNIFGVHKLWPTISPGKTWEGFFGGYCCALITFLLLDAGYLHFSFSLPFAALLTGITCIFSTAGDLFESWLKRKAGIKDSGNLLPAHGGFLDRFDGLLFVAVLFSILQALI
ncbi:MAG: phosphatidate cytidylyltransferase [Candidatus Babeliales bacterium]